MFTNVSFYFCLHVIRFAIATSEEMRKFILKIFVLTMLFLVSYIASRSLLTKEMNLIASDKIDLISLISTKIFVDDLPTSSERLKLQRKILVPQQRNK